MNHCETCEHFLETDPLDIEGVREYDGMCVRYPPRVVGPDAEFFLQPAVDRTMGCGEHKTKGNR